MEKRQVIIIGSCSSAVSLALEQLRFQRQDLEILLLEIEQVSHTVHRVSLEDIQLRTNELRLELARYARPQTKYVWKEDVPRRSGRRGFNSARSRIICKAAYC